jgi:hypothetical protein
MTIQKDLYKQRAIVLLAAYDATALYLALQSLSKTVSDDDVVVVILNGKRGIRAASVEDVSRAWAKGRPNRFVVRPLNYGNDPYNSIKEVLEGFPVLQDRDFICKIDDDLIPLQVGWLDKLHLEYLAREQHSPVGFVTSLINNNAWGFAQLIDIFDKEAEYRQIMNYPSTSGEGQVAAGEVASGVFGSVWQYPYLAKWCHEWTLLDTKNYIEKTAGLASREIPPDTHYSIGCIFFRKQLWTDCADINALVNFDELAIHRYCQQQGLKKVAVMNEPMGHLYYFIQRKANASLFPLFAQALASHWQDNGFMDYPKYDQETFMMIQFEELANTVNFQNINASESKAKDKKKSFFRRLG